MTISQCLLGKLAVIRQTGVTTKHERVRRLVFFQMNGLVSTDWMSRAARAYGVRNALNGFEVENFFIND